MERAADLGQMATLHRQVAALTVAASHAGVDHEELSGVRARIVRQRARFTVAAVAARTATPVLTPTPHEIATGGARLGDFTPEALGHALRAASSTLDTIDAALSGYQVRPLTSTAVRDGAIYAAYAMGVVVLQVVLFIAVGETELPLLAPLCLVVLPALAWLAGWSTVGIAFRSPDTGWHRHARLGAFICLAPNLLLCGMVGVLFVLSH